MCEEKYSALFHPLSIFCEDLDGECFEFYNCDNCKYRGISEYEKKERFCRHELLALLKAIDKKILRLEYEVKNAEETVYIVWLQNYGEYRKAVNVTADSLAAIARDVLKQI